MSQAATAAEEMLTTQDACRLLKVTRQTLYKLVEAGKVKAKKVGRGYRFDRKELSISPVASAPSSISELDGDATSSKRVWELRGNFATAGIKKMAKRTFSDLAANVEELIANAYDADATTVDIVVDQDEKTLTVQDDGNGMTEHELQSYVVYGESGKTREAYHSPRFNRLPIGEYGMGGKLAISNLSRFCRVVTWRDSEQHVLNMDGDQLNNAQYLSDVRHQVVTSACPFDRHGTVIHMSNLHYKHVDSDRLIERISMKMPHTQNFTIGVTVKQGGKRSRKELTEPRFETVRNFRFEANLKHVGPVRVELFYTKEPIPATKQGIWTKVNGRIVNEKQEWFGLLSLHSGNRYRWRLYGYGHADGLKEFVTFSKNDFVDGPAYREYYEWVASKVKEVQDRLLDEDEHVAKQKEKHLIKDLENRLNRWVRKLNEPEVQERLANKLQQEALSGPPDDDEEDMLQLPFETPLGSAIDEIIKKRDSEKRRMKHSSRSGSTSLAYKGKGYRIETVDMSQGGDLVKFTKTESLVEINDHHPLYAAASKGVMLDLFVRDVAMMEVARDIADDDLQRFELVFNQLAGIAAETISSRE